MPDQTPGGMIPPMSTPEPVPGTTPSPFGVEVSSPEPQPTLEQRVAALERTVREIAAKVLA